MVVVMILVTLEGVETRVNGRGRWNGMGWGNKEGWSVVMGGGWVVCVFLTR